MGFRGLGVEGLRGFGVQNLGVPGFRGLGVWGVGVQGITGFGLLGFRASGLSGFRAFGCVRQVNAVECRHANTPRPPSHNSQQATTGASHQGDAGQRTKGTSLGWTRGMLGTSACQKESRRLWATGGHWEAWEDGLGDATEGPS